MNFKEQKSCCLAVTGLIETWDLSKKMIFLGPWCLVAQENRKKINGCDYSVIPSPFKPSEKIVEAQEYCEGIYQSVIRNISVLLNQVHGVAYSHLYWDVLLHHWLRTFIQTVYERYARLEKVISDFEDFYVYVLPKDKCSLTCEDTYNYFCGQSNVIEDDFYNWKIISLLVHEMMPDCAIVRSLPGKQGDFVSYPPQPKIRNIVERIFLNNIENDDVTKLFTDMYHLGIKDKRYFLKNIGSIGFDDFYKTIKVDLKADVNFDKRKKLLIKNISNDRFVNVLYSLLSDAIPKVFVEHYALYRQNALDNKNLFKVSEVSSAVGWFFNEEFKFFAAEAQHRGAKLIGFQHGGNFGASKALPAENVFLSKDVFYTWGWQKEGYNNAKPLVSAHMSKLMDSHEEKRNELVFVSGHMMRYAMYFHTHLMPDDMFKYLDDKEVFFSSLDQKILEQVVYRCSFDCGWNEQERIRRISKNIRFSQKGRLSKRMQSARMVVIDHPHTGFLEALAINVPCIFYWDHDVYLMRDEAKTYFEKLRAAGIVYDNPQEAAVQVSAVYADKLNNWWQSTQCQMARIEFCNRFARFDKNWKDLWVSEIESGVQKQKNSQEISVG